jgi:phage replication-related protein YjqB (UPF0714/DUF867 family)
MVDKYQSMTQLFQFNQEYEDYCIECVDNASTNLITAVHGGAIERGTSELAQLIARKGEIFILYFLKGVKEIKIMNCM